MIPAGKMNERVELQSPAESRGPTGESTLAFTTQATVWASVDGLSTREFMQAQQANLLATHRVRIRHYPALTHEWRVKWRGRAMEIASVLDKEHAVYHELLVREVQ
jgi:SPP1 family predicted phage head-tail adaptor